MILSQLNNQENDVTKEEPTAEKCEEVIEASQKKEAAEEITSDILEQETGICYIFLLNHVLKRYLL